MRPVIAWTNVFWRLTMGNRYVKLKSQLNYWFVFFILFYLTNSSLTTGITSGPVNTVHKNRIVTGQRTSWTTGAKYLSELIVFFIFTRPSHCAWHIDKPYRLKWILHNFDDAPVCCAIPASNFSKYNFSPVPWLNLL